MVDEGSNMIVKSSPEGKVLMTLGRKPEDFAGIPGPVAEDESAGGKSGGALLQQLLLSARPAGPAGCPGGGAGAGGGGGEGVEKCALSTLKRENHRPLGPPANIFRSDG